ncbi:hypothetical protein ACH5RR_025369 [Cinchona calisaya]|uniref:PAZ domain-containing protein n=1 Tax=Cinchona calisaya TaxID=153742 RepID=A0ABD2YZF9_9GENT
MPTFSRLNDASLPLNVLLITTNLIRFYYRPHKGSNQDDVIPQIEMTVYDYFKKVLGIALTYSADLPCNGTGKPCSPFYFPIELCSLVSLQRYKKALSIHQRSLMVKKSSIKPEDLFLMLTKEVKHCDYNADPVLSSCGLSVTNWFTQVDGRVLAATMLKVGNKEDVIPRNASWSFRDKVIKHFCVYIFVFLFLITVHISNRRSWSQNELNIGLW